jgi:Tfp pilus assembly protein PilF
VLETRHGNASDAREVFQQGIWACAQPSGGQSGGRHCARLWQAWGVLEAQEYDYAAARRCFSRALDADKRNVAAITAWTLMEQELGQYNDAKLIFERKYGTTSPFFRVIQSKTHDLPYLISIQHRYHLYRCLETIQPI